MGGTSAAAPQWSALVAVADQGRQAAGQAPLANAQATLYSLASAPTTYAADFHDVTSGTAGGNSAGTAYDLVTGLGSPVASNLVTSLVTASTATNGGSAGAVATSNTTGSASTTDTTSNTPDPRELIEIILFTTPRLLENGPAIVPIIINPTTNIPAPVASVALPADTPVHLAINSLLVDDPLDVPLRPAKRRATDAAPHQQTPDVGQPPSEGVFLWDSDPFADEAWLDDLAGARLGPTTMAAELADCCFADGDVLGHSMNGNEIALSAVGFVDAEASRFLGLASMFLAAIVVDHGRPRQSGNGAATFQAEATPPLPSKRLGARFWKWRRR